jgi:hypothetical protein
MNGFLLASFIRHSSRRAERIFFTSMTAAAVSASAELIEGAGIILLAQAMLAPLSVIIYPARLLRVARQQPHDASEWPKTLFRV